MSIERPRPTVIEGDANAGVPFYIPATSPETRLRRTLKHDDTFLVIDAHGDLGASAGTGDGLFYRDTRFHRAMACRRRLPPGWSGTTTRRGRTRFPDSSARPHAAPQRRRPRFRLASATL